MLVVVVAHIYVIEFQKRGLPHAHLLLILADSCKLRNPSDIDSVISAEIPDPNTEPQLHDVIRSTMVHGPCGILNRNAVCMANDKCSKDYPKQFQEETVLAVNGYPNYQRRDNGMTINVGRYQVDNRWIVPYNPYLSKSSMPTLMLRHVHLSKALSIFSNMYTSVTTVPA